VNIRRKSSIIDLFTEANIILFIIVSVIPYVILDSYRIEGWPLINFIYLSVFIVLFKNAFVINYGNIFLIIIYCGSGLLMIIVGLLNHKQDFFSVKFFIQDIAIYSALPLGVSWAQVNSVDDIISHFRKWFLIILFIFISTIIGLQTGLLYSSGGEFRLLDPNAYGASFALIILFPLVWSKGSIKPSMIFKHIIKLIYLLGIFAVLYFAYISQTRSVLLTTLFTIGIIFVVIFYKVKGLVGTLIILSMIFISAFIILELPSYDIYVPDIRIVDSIANINLRDEARFYEIDWMLSQLGYKLLYGSGFGVGYWWFIDPLTYYVEISYYPHIGIFTLLYKGGILVFILCIVLPIAFALFNFFVRPISQRAMACQAGVLIYAFQSCISGGFYFLPLFLLGIYIQIIFRKELYYINNDYQQALNIRSI